MKVIYKYQLTRTAAIQFNELNLFQDAEFLSAKMQGENLCCWFLVETTNGKEHRRFKIYGTGHEILEEDYLKEKYLDTIMDGPFVWHLFERIK